MSNHNADLTKSTADGLSRGEYVHARLKQAIHEGRYLPGTRIRETEVADWLGVSRTPVREAVRRLQADGLLMFEPWRGVVVAELDHDELIELYAMRQMLEGAAARLAAQHAARSEIATMEDHLRAAEQTDDPKGLADANRRFHGAIAQAAHNRYLLAALNVLRDATALMRDTTYSIDGRPAEAQAEHIALLEAIRQKDADQAEELGRQHIANAERARLKVVAGHHAYSEKGEGE